MGRAPCCEKTGLNKGSWTPEEDQILISFIHKNGHENWRALPRQAGLLRCGKSCRLRWTNYLRPDIKRGKFTLEEQQIVINLHKTLGNRWSAIASKLPGRTDNEIKNVWHTHLKKKVKDDDYQSKITPEGNTEITLKIMTLIPKLDDLYEESPILSPQYSSSELSSSVSVDLIQQYENCVNSGENWIRAKEEVQFHFPLFDADQEEEDNAFIARLEDGFAFWCDLVNKDSDLPYLPSF